MIQRKGNETEMTADQHDTGLMADKLILLIVCVINCTDQDKHKMENIKNDCEGELVKRTFMGTCYQKMETQRKSAAPTDRMN